MSINGSEEEIPSEQSSFTETSKDLEEYETILERLNKNKENLFKKTTICIEKAQKQIGK